MQMEELGLDRLSGINEGRWGGEKNTTVQIKPWVRNFKDEMYYSCLITSGSDCVNTNCKQWGTENVQHTQRTQNANTSIKPQHTWNKQEKNQRWCCLVFEL